MIPPTTLSVTQPATTRIVIQGVTSNGRAFRPSDWAERLCGIMSTFGGDHQMRYSPHVRPVMMDGVRCVVGDALQEHEVREVPVRDEQRGLEPEEPREIALQVVVSERIARRRARSARGNAVAIEAGAQRVTNLGRMREAEVVASRERGEFSAAHAHGAEAGVLDRESRHGINRPAAYRTPAESSPWCLIPACNSTTPT